MSKVAVVYWSSTGNTESMANAVADGANVSWGRYWAWDPKEVWALISFLIYGAAFHGPSLAVFRQPRFFHAYMVLAFLTVLMTYFGVNYLLGGMHSYA